MILTATLGSIELPLASVQNIPPLVWQTTFVPGGRGDVPRAGRIIAPDVRTIPLDIIVEAESDEDTGDLDAFISAVNLALSTQNTLVLENDEGETAAFYTYPSDPLPVPVNDLYRHGLTYRETMQVRVQPYAYGALDTISEADLETPGSVDLSGMTGEYPAALTVEVGPGTAMADMHSIWLALCADESWAGYVVEATAVTGWDDEVADAELGVNVVRFAAADPADTGTVDVSDFPGSSYLVLARVKVTAGGSLVISHEYGNDVTETLDHYQWVSLGEVVLPTRKVRGAGTTTLSLTADATTQAAYCHRLAFLPLRWGFCRYHDEDSSSADISALRVEWEDIYVDDVVDYENILGGGLKCLGGQLIVLTEEAAGTALHQHADVDVTYNPRRNWLG